MKRRTLTTVKKRLLTTNELAELINRRLVFLLGVMLISFGLIAYQLFHITIINEAYYSQRLAIYTRTLQTITTPRGNMIDRNNTVLVSNRLVLNIVYFPKSGIKKAEEWSLAQTFKEYFKVDEKTMNLADLRDLFIFLYPTEAKNLMDEAELEAYRLGQLTDGEYHSLMSNKLTDDHLARLTKAEKQAYLIYQAMKAPSSGRPKLILADVSSTDVAVLLEHSAIFPGFYHDTSWERVYPQGELLRSVLGSVTSNKQGILAENLNYYLALDYARNERVGRSGLELEYEELISGERLIQNLTYNKEGLLNIEVIQEGAKGNDLRLSFDLELQKATENIAIKLLEKYKNNVYRKYLDKLLMVILDPVNGDVLTLVGMNRSKQGTYYNDGSLTYLNAYAPGSAIKGSVVYMGLAEHLIKPNEVISDAPVRVAGTPPKSSSRNLSNIYDLRALSESSNVFMFHIALRLAGIRYYPGVSIGKIQVSDFMKIRNYFSMFGLGTSTGLDVPLEATGYVGSNPAPGNLLDFVIGQYDTYTTMQLAQYAATVANDGKKVRPRILLEAYQADSDLLVYNHQPEILSTLNDAAAIKRVQQGFRLCVTNGLCALNLSGAKVPLAAKTGTAESLVQVDGKYYSSPNSSLVAYAPYQNPQIAIACMAPNAWNTRTQGNICGEMTKMVIDYYFARK